MAHSLLAFVGLGFAGLLGPTPLSAQQTASVVVRVNVIRVPVTPAALDSLGRALLDDATQVTRARVEARARRRGLRVWVERVEDRPLTGSGARDRDLPPVEPRDVVRVEYVAN